MVSVGWQKDKEIREKCGQYVHPDLKSRGDCDSLRFKVRVIKG